MRFVGPTTTFICGQPNNSSMTSVCDSCQSFKNFGEKCWFFWKDKKSCSQYREGLDQEPHFESVLIPLKRLM